MPLVVRCNCEFAWSTIITESTRFDANMNGCLWNRLTGLGVGDNETHLEISFADPMNQLSYSPSHQQARNQRDDDQQRAQAELEPATAEFARCVSHEQFRKSLAPRSDGSSIVLRWQGIVQRIVVADH